MIRRILSLIMAVLLLTSSLGALAAQERYTVREAYMYFAQAEPEFILSVLDNGYEAGVTERQILNFLYSIQRAFYIRNRFTPITSENFQDNFIDIMLDVSNAAEFSNIQDTLNDTYPDATDDALDGKIHEDFLPLFNTVKEMILERNMIAELDTPGDLSFELQETAAPEGITVNQLESVSMPETARALSESGLWVKVPARWNEEPDTAYPGSVTVRGRILLPDGYKEASGFENLVREEITVIPISASGKCGLLAKWTLENGVLTISGSGNIYDYSDPDDVPWAPYKDAINKVSIISGVRTIGKNAFSGLTKLSNKTVELPSTLRTISSGAFSGSIVESIVVSTNMNDIALDAFDAEGLTVYGGKSGGVADLYCQKSGARFVPDDYDLPYVISLAAKDGKVTVNSINISGGLYAAQYGSGMRLLSLAPVEGSTIELTSDEVRYVKVFLWEENTLEPVCASRVTRV